MTTDITELAQREKFEAWAEHACAAPWGYLKKRRTTEGYSEQIYTCMWTAWKAASAELVEALEKAQLESRTVTVKLPADNAAESESPENDASAWFDEGWNARGKADKEAIAAAGIKWEAE